MSGDASVAQGNCEITVSRACENEARLAQTPCRQPRRHTQRVRLQGKVSRLSSAAGLCCLFHRAVGSGPAHRNKPRARHARANQWQQITKQLAPQLNRSIRRCVAGASVVLPRLVATSKVWHRVTNLAWGKATK